MGTRYDNRMTRRTRAEDLGTLLSRRNRDSAEHYKTPEFLYPDEEDIGDFNFVSHIWTVGSRFYKLAHTHYGDSGLWWVIAFYNNKPTEHHVKPGDVIFIPLPVDLVLDSMGM